MGWLGWTEEQALQTDVNSIMVAMEGRLEMLYPQGEKRSIESDFKDFVKQHNERVT